MPRVNAMHRLAFTPGSFLRPFLDLQTFPSTYRCCTSVLKPPFLSPCEAKSAPMLLRSFALGIVAAVVALVFATLSPGHGVKLNTEAWPASAKAILIERPGQAISNEQWRRIEKALETGGNNSRPSHLVAAEVRKSWPAVLLFAIIALVLARWLFKPQSLAAAGAILAPSALLLAAAFAHGHPYYP
jgi:hypothetical protein